MGFTDKGLHHWLVSIETNQPYLKSSQIIKLPQFLRPKKKNNKKNFVKVQFQSYSSVSISKFSFNLTVQFQSQSSVSISKFSFNLKVQFQSQSSVSISQFSFNLKVQFQSQSSRIPIPKTTNSVSIANFNLKFSPQVRRGFVG